MTLIITNTYHVELPENFEKVVAEFEYFTCQNTKLTFTVQPAQINMALSRQDELDDWCEGTTFVEKLQSYFKQKRYNLTVGAFTETILCGATLYIQHATSSYKPAGQKKEHEFCHIFAVLLVDETYMLEFSTDCEKEVSEILTPEFLKTLESLVLLGNIERYYEIQNTALDLRYGKIEEKLEEITKSAEAITESLGGEKNLEQLVAVGLPKIPEFEIPKDGKNICKIGDYIFDFKEDECQFSIPEFSRKLYIKLAAQHTGKKIPESLKLLSDYNDEQRIELSISLSQICKEGKTEGKFEIIEDRTESESLYKDGFEYSLDFYGTLEIRDGWLVFLGYLRDPYYGKPNFPVTIYKNIENYPLAWEEYIFTSYEETLGVDEQKIRYLHFIDPDFEVFPVGVEKFTGLKEIRVNHKGYYETEKLPLKSIPEYIGDLKELEVLALHSVHISHIPESLTKLTLLKNLAIDNALLTKLPESLGNLIHLESLSFQDNLITHISEGVFQLQKLNYFNLKNNKLTCLPENISLPTLKSINLEGNLLSTLPESLTRQEVLTHISLEDNPLAKLPEVFNDFPSLGLKIEDKKRLLDYRYRGADGSGTISWNDKVFFAASDESLRAFVDDVLKGQDTSDTRFSSLIPLTKKTLYFQQGEIEDYSTLGNIRFGGMPDLPKNRDYPTFIGYDKSTYKYEFLAQINCGAVAHQQDFLPRTGILYFFFETIHSLYGRYNKNPIQVWYVEDTSSLISGKHLHFEDSQYFEMFDGGYTGYKVDSCVGISSPSFYALRTNQYLVGGRKDIIEDQDFTESLYDTFEKPINDPMEHQAAMNVYGFTQHESPELQATHVHKGNPEDWIILLKINSFADFQWGDAGDLFFVIHKSDLAKRDFSRVFVTMESS